MPITYHLAILGAGSTAAHHLNTLDRNRYPSILLIGEDDPWSGQRGLNPAQKDDPVNFINQTENMIGHYGDSVPPVNQTLVPRQAYAQANSRIIDKCVTKRVKAQIRRVTTFQKALSITSSQKQTLYSISAIENGSMTHYHVAKVIVATGAGSHKFPDPRFEKLAQQHPKIFMDMDAFARQPQLKDPKKTIIVQGPNAAVDTADTAAWAGMNVIWLANRPAILPTPHQTGARAVIAKKQIYALNRDQQDPESITVANNQVTIKIRSGQTFIADYYVWGVGQDSDGAVSFIDRNIRKQLEPIYDKNQRFGPAHESVLGFQLPDTDSTSGFEVIGALSRQVLLAAGKEGISHTYLQQLVEVITSLQAKLNTYAGQEVERMGRGMLLEPIERLSKRSPAELIAFMRMYKQ
jgi:hypothetical protein